MESSRAFLRSPLVLLVLVMGLAAQVMQASDRSVKEIFTQWDPKNVDVADYHSFDVLAPNDVQPTLRGVSFSSSQPFADLWKFYAAKCSIALEFAEGNTYVVSGTNNLGSYFLVERSSSPKQRESVFGLRTETYSVSVTLRNSLEIPNRSTAGTVVVSLR